MRAVDVFARCLLAVALFVGLVILWDVFAGGLWFPGLRVSALVFLSAAVTTLLTVPHVWHWREDPVSTDALQAALNGRALHLYITSGHNPWDVVGCIDDVADVINIHYCNTAPQFNRELPKLALGRHPRVITLATRLDHQPLSRRRLLNVLLQV